MSISLGLVGLGSFGSQFAELFHAHPLVGRIALCDREPDRIKRFADLPAWQAKLDRDATSTRFEDLLDSDLSASKRWSMASMCTAPCPSSRCPTRTRSWNGATGSFAP